jgi:hypothetical protein
MATATKDLAERIRHLCPCDDAMQWLRTLPAGTRPLKAWRLCERGDWMLWLICKQVTSSPWSEDRKPLLACCLDCAETVKHLWPKAEKIAAAVGVLHAWISGTATVEQAQKARRELYAVAAYADAAAADAVAAAADAAAADAAAADAVAAAGGAVADADAARKKTLAECAEIVRSHYPKPPVLT